MLTFHIESVSQDLELQVISYLMLDMLLYYLMLDIRNKRQSIIGRIRNVLKTLIVGYTGFTSATLHSHINR